MIRRIAIVAAGFLLVLLALSFVSIDVGDLAQKGVRTTWWWSGALPLLVGAAMPPIFGIAMVMATRRLLPSLAAGVLLAAVLASGPSPFAAVGKFIGIYIWGAVTDNFHLAIMLFTVALIGLVHVANQSGGTQGIVKFVQRYASGVRGTRMATAVMGLAVFFDDYANTAIVGPTMRPLFDRMRLSREKLAYLIDSTAAPVAGLALISTWIGAEVGYLQEAAESVGVTTSGYQIFITALGYRFYCVFALVLVFVTSWTGRDFGPMLTAEIRALTTGQVVRPGGTPLSAGSEAPMSDAPPRWYNAIVPIGTVLGIIIFGIYIAGAPADAGLGDLLVGLFSAGTWQEAFLTAANLMDEYFLGYLFAVAALIGSVVVIAMPRVQGVLSIKEALQAWWHGAKSVAPALAVLILAWSLAAGCKDLNTAKYVGAAITGVGAAWVPLVVFIVAGLVAFATGTSWGTMGILVPTAGAVAYEAGGEMVMIIAMAAVLDGAIFGDHCSPISDTTVLSSICSGSDHIDHVRTQAPYAILGAAVAAGCGYALVAAGGVPNLVGYLLGAGILIAVVRLIGRRSEDAPGATSVGAAVEGGGESA